MPSQPSAAARLALAATLTLGLASPAARAALVVTEVQPQTTAGTAATINGDWWELTNTGPAAVNLAGYQWGDTDDTIASAETNFFPSVSLAAGASLIVSEENDADELAFRQNWANLPTSVIVLNQDEMIDDATPETPTPDKFSGLGASNDGVYFYSPTGELLSSYAYATSTRGTTFEQSATGQNLGLSVVGENGAFRATNNDVGSPGVAAVPEPATLAAAVGIAGAAIIRRRR